MTQQLDAGNPGDPSVYTFMVAPEIHANLYEQLSGLFFAEVGGEHTGGEQMQPSISFAGGFGGGLEYALTSRIAIRAEGDRVAGSFTLTNDLPGYGYSTHRTWNARGTIGLSWFTTSKSRGQGNKALCLMAVPQAL